MINFSAMWMLLVTECKGGVWPYSLCRRVMLAKLGGEGSVEVVIAQITEAAPAIQEQAQNQNQNHHYSSQCLFHLIPLISRTQTPIDLIRVYRA